MPHNLSMNGAKYTYLTTYHLYSSSQHKHGDFFMVCSRTGTEANHGGHWRQAPQGGKKHCHPAQVPSPFSQTVNCAAKRQSEKT